MLYISVRYMNRRCAFLENLPGFNYNPGAGEYKKKGSDDKTDTTELGSTLMKTMLHEVEEFCDPVSKHDWSMKPHQQVRNWPSITMHVVMLGIYHCS